MELLMQAAEMEYDGRNNERISLTCAERGENHTGNEIKGVFRKQGYSASDIEAMGDYYAKMFKGNSLKESDVSVLDLNVLSMVKEIDDLPDEDQARLLIVRDWAKNTLNEPDFQKNIYKECTNCEWDSKYLDPNKYTTHIVNGEEKRTRGRVMNKKARRNIMFIKGEKQEPSYIEGKGRIEDLCERKTLHDGLESLKTQLREALKICGSKSKVEIHVVEGNRYYDLKNTGIGFHGDTERVVVICLTVGGGGNFPMRFQWFKDKYPVGKPIDIYLNDGDLYIMSHKTVGCDWKKSSRYTLRHAAGAPKYLSLKKWEKRLEERAGNKKILNKKIVKKAEKKAVKKAVKKKIVKKAEKKAVKKAVKKTENKKTENKKIVKKAENKKVEPHTLNVLKTDILTVVLVEVPKFWSMEDDKINILMGEEFDNICVGEQGKHDLVGPLYKDKDGINTYMLVDKK